MHVSLNPVFFFYPVKLNTVQINIRFILNKLLYFSRSLKMGKHNLFSNFCLYVMHIAHP